MSMVMAKQPHLERHWCSEIVSIARRGKDGRLQSIVGNLEEIGERTLVVLTETFVPLGTWMRIQCQNCELRGIAESRDFDRHLGFFVKVRLAPESRWSMRRFEPDHLFTVKDVLLRGPQLRHSA
jgi:hypothetical protein